MIELMSESWFDKRLAPFKGSKIKIAENKFKSVEFPQNYENVFKEGMSDSKTILRTGIGRFLHIVVIIFRGLLAKDKQLAEQSLQEFIDKLKNILNTNDLSSKQILIKYNYFIAMARKN